MIQLTDIHSLSDFQRNAKTHLKQMKKTGRPQVLTINGKAELIVQDAKSYQKLLDAAERLDALEGIQRGLASLQRGEGRPVVEALAALQQKYEIPSA